VAAKKAVDKKARMWNWEAGGGGVVTCITMKSTSGRVTIQNRNWDTLLPGVSILQIDPKYFDIVISLPIKIY